MQQINVASNYSNLNGEYQNSLYIKITCFKLCLLKYFMKILLNASQRVLQCKILNKQLFGRYLKLLLSKPN